MLRGTWPGELSSSLWKRLGDGSSGRAKPAAKGISSLVGFHSAAQQPATVAGPVLVRRTVAFPEEALVEQGQGSPSHHQW